MSDSRTIFSDLMTFMDTNMGSGLIKTISGFIESISPIFASLFAFYIMLWVFNYWANGGLVEMGVDFIKKLVAWSLIIAFAFNATEYSKLADIIYNLDMEVSKTFTQNNSAYTGNAIDLVLDEIDNLANKLLEQYSNAGFFDRVGHAFEYLGNVLALYLVCGIFLGISFGFYIVAKGLLALTLLTGPLYIALGLFPATRNYMTNWINQCFNCMWSCVFIGLVGQLQLKFLKMITPDYSSFVLSGAYSFNIALLISTIVYIILIFKVPALSAALTGGASTDGVGFMRFAASRIPGMASATKAGGKSAYNKATSWASAIRNKISNGGS